jgi:hypothetical protein
MPSPLAPSVVSPYARALGEGTACAILQPSARGTVLRRILKAKRLPSRGVGGLKCDAKIARRPIWLWDIKDIRGPGGFAILWVPRQPLV